MQVKTTISCTERRNWRKERSREMRKDIVLWTFRAKEGRRAFRWKLELIFWAAGAWLGLQQQVSFLEQGATWEDNSTHFAIHLRRNWAWGENHLWYDGYYCSRSFGLITLAWGYWHCDKCLPPEC